MQKKLFHLYLKVNLYSKLYTMTQKTKILTLSLVSVAGLAAFTVFASNNTSLLDFKEVKQNINLELKQLNLMPDITQKNNGGAAGISWKIVWDTLTTVDPRAKDAPNTVTKQGKFSFGGHGNITNAAESLILAGEENNLSANTSIVGASKKIVGNQGEGNTVLSSSDITFAGDNHIISSSAGTQVNGTGNIVFSSEDVAINTIGSMAVGKKIRITHPGSFIFNGTDRDVASNKAYTTKIMADKGMIINTNSQKADGVDLTINGGLKVSHNTTDNAWAIISEARCLRIKGVNKGEIWFWCSTTPETQISTPKCGKNAADYLATANAWKESTDKGFCENGTLSPSTRPTFWTDAEKAAAKSNGSYASAGFGNYSFTICFVEGDPFCKASGAKKTWRCTTQEGNAMTCEATIAAEAKKCKANEHLEGTTCVANTKQVACDNTNLNSANGTVSNNQVTITRSNGRWSAPEKCKLNCNTGYEKKTDPITHRESCEKQNKYEWKCEETTTVSSLNWKCVNKLSWSAPCPKEQSFKPITICDKQGRCHQWLRENPKDPRESFCAYPDCSLNKDELSCNSAHILSDELSTQKIHYCKWEQSSSFITSSKKKYTCIDKTTGQETNESHCKGLVKPMLCSLPTVQIPPKTALIVRCNPAPTEISFKNWNGTVKTYWLNTNPVVPDTYYTIVNEIIIPREPQVTIGNWFGIKSWITMNLTETDFDLGKTEEKLGLTDNDSVIIYQCPES